MYSFPAIEQKSSVITFGNRKTLKVGYYESGSGFPILFLHGLGASSDVWLPAIEKLRHKFHCYALDFPGHGHSDRSEDTDIYTNSNILDLTRVFCETIVKSPRFALVGNSVGGTLALLLVKQIPDSISQIVVVSPAGIGKEISLRLRLATLPFLGELMFSPIILKIGFNVARKQFKVSDYRYHLAPKLLEHFLAIGSKAAILFSLRHNATWKGTRNPLIEIEDLRSITCPILIFWGTKDPVVPVEHAEILENLLPNCQLIIIKNAGHGSHLDEPSTFYSAIGRFLREEI